MRLFSYLSPFGLYQAIESRRGKECPNGQKLPRTDRYSPKLVQRLGAPNLERALMALVDPRPDLAVRLRITSDWERIPIWTAPCLSSACPSGMERKRENPDVQAQNKLFVTTAIHPCYPRYPWSKLDCSFTTDSTDLTDKLVRQATEEARTCAPNMALSSYTLRRAHRVASHAGSFREVTPTVFVCETQIWKNFSHRARSKTGTQAIVLQKAILLEFDELMEQIVRSTLVGVVY